MPLMIELYFIVGLTCCIGGFVYAAYGNHADGLEGAWAINVIYDKVNTILLFSVISIVFWPYILFLGVWELIDRFVIKKIRSFNIDRHINKELNTPSNLKKKD
jgi:hypothetical protein